MIVAAIYLLYMVGKIVLGPLKEPSGHGHHDDDAHALPADLTPREIGILGVLAVACLVLGVLPGPMLKSIDAPIEATLAAMGVVDAPAVALAPAELKEATP